MNNGETLPFLPEQGACPVVVLVIIKREATNKNAVINLLIIEFSHVPVNKYTRKN